MLIRTIQDKLQCLRSCNIHMHGLWGLQCSSSPVATVPSGSRKHHLHLTFSNQCTNLFSDISVFSFFRRQLRVHQAEKYNPRHVRHWTITLLYNSGSQTFLKKLRNGSLTIFLMAHRPLKELTSLSASYIMPTFASVTVWFRNRIRLP